MSKSAKSLYIFGIYLLLLGIALIIIPNFILGIFNYEKTSEPWIRVVGMLLVIITPYYFYTSKHELRGFIQLTVYTRASVILFFILFVVTGIAKPILLLIGCADLIGALWTQLSLSAEKSAPQSD